MSQFLSLVVFVSLPFAAIIGLGTLVRVFIDVSRRALVTDAIVCIACWGLGSLVIGWLGQLGAGDNAPLDKRLESGIFYGVSWFLIGALPIAGVAFWRYRTLSQGASAPKPQV